VNGGQHCWKACWQASPGTFDSADHGIWAARAQGGSAACWPERLATQAAAEDGDSRCGIECSRRGEDRSRRSGPPVAVATGIGLSLALAPSLSGPAGAATVHPSSPSLMTGRGEWCSRRLSARGRPGPVFSVGVCWPGGAVRWASGLHVSGVVRRTTGTAEETIAFVIWPVIPSFGRSRHRWLMACTDRHVAEMVGAFGAGIR